MYSKRAGLILGFHGCDETIRDRVVSEKGFLLSESRNDYDWLGNGVYFWENNYQRALQYATDLMNNPIKGKSEITKPSVIGAVIDLGFCMDLLDTEYLKLLRAGYDFLLDTNKTYEFDIPENRPIEKQGDLLIRKLDCSVIETVHQINRDLEKPNFDTVRGVFFEGDNLYPNAGFKEKNHIQIAIRNPNCIKGYFIPRELDPKFNKP